MAVFNVAGYLIEERHRWPVITASPRGQHSSWPRCLTPLTTRPWRRSVDANRNGCTSQGKQFVVSVSTSAGQWLGAVSLHTNLSRGVFVAAFLGSLLRHRVLGVDQEPRSRYEVVETALLVGQDARLVPLVTVLPADERYRGYDDARVLTGTYGHLRVLTGTYEYLRALTGTYGYLRVLTGTYEYLRALTGTYRYLRVLTGTYGYLRVLTGTYGYLRVLTGTYGYLRVLTGAIPAAGIPRQLRGSWFTI